MRSNRATAQGQTGAATECGGGAWACSTEGIVVFSADVRSPESFPAGVEAGRLEARTWTLGVQGELGPLVGMLAGLPVKDMQVGEARLEDVLVAYYREDSQ